MMGTPVWGSGPSFVLTESGVRVRPSHWIARGINYLYTCHFKCLNFEAVVCDALTPVGRFGNYSRPPRPLESKVLPRSASEVKSQQLCGCWETNGPTKRLSLLHPFAVFNCFFLGDQQVWPLQCQNLRPSVYTFEMWKGYLWFAGNLTLFQKWNTRD